MGGNFPSVMSTFAPPTRSLLNPKFESYKLALIEQSDAVNQYALPSPGASQSTISGHNHLSFKEVQSRIRHNHLCVGWGNECMYVDKDGGVVLVVMNEVSVLEILYISL
jgi:hypothetical protein